MAEHASSRLHVRGLPDYVKEKRLKEFFSAKGDVTDVKVVRTRDGRSRRFGFVGFRTAEQAAAAQAYFNRAFLDTCKLEVNLARPIGDSGLERPWSKYSAGSSAHKALHPDAYAAAEGEGDAAAAEAAAAASSGKAASKKEAKLLEFLGVMGGGRGKSWKNDDLTAEDLSSAAAADAGSGSDDEYEDLPSSKVEEAGEDSDSDAGDSEEDDSDDDGSDDDEDEAEDEDDDTAAHDESLSDMDYLRSKMKKSLDGDEGSDGDEDSDDDDSDDDDSDDDTATKTDDKPTVDDVSDSGRLYVRNLPFSATEEDVTALFSSYGRVLEVHIPVDETKRSKGYAFVLFMMPMDAVRALTELDGQYFQGRILHILAARPSLAEEEEAAGEEGGDFKSARDKEKKKAAADEAVWSTLLIRSDTVVDALAERLGMSKGQLLDREADSMAVKLALGETHIIRETKKFLVQQGVALDALEEAVRGEKVKRSSTTLFVKNLPFATELDELRQLFARFGTLARLVMPPSKAIALVEFADRAEARRAFRGLSFKKFRHVPLYLEWAPDAVFSKPARTAAAADESKKHKSSGKSKASAKAGEEEEEDAAEEESKTSSASSSASSSAAAAAAAAAVSAGPVTVADDGYEDPDAGNSATLFVKNLNFDTTKETLEKAMRKAGGVRAASIAQKRNPRGPGMLSMGYGFVEFKTRKAALKAVKRLQGIVIDGHKLQLKFSSKRLTEPTRQRKRSRGAGGEQTTKFIVKNLAFEATKSDLRELFGEFGQLKSVRLPMKADGSHRGFGFVEFLTAQEAKNAYTALAASHLYGRHLVIEYAKDKSDMATLRSRAASDVRAIRGRKRRRTDDGFASMGGAEDDWA